MSRLGLLAVLVWSTALVAQPTTYAVNSAESYIHIYTGTAGIFEMFSHRHLVAITRIQGEVSITPEESSAHLIVQPEDFLVDDNAERARAADPEYREPVSEDIQTDTKTNMLGDRQLHADRYPEIRVDIQLDRLSATPILDVTVHILGREQHLQIPAILDVDEQHVWATGYFELSHSDLGIEPYTAFGGLLRVAEGLRMQFKIVAESAIVAQGQN